jgi:hypothetical protein
MAHAAEHSPDRHPREDPAKKPRKDPAYLIDLAMLPVDRSPESLLDAVQRNVGRTADALGRLTGVGFECGCQLTLAGGDDGRTPWRVMAWDDTHCTWIAHRALKAKWEAGNLL